MVCLSETLGNPFLSCISPAELASSVSAKKEAGLTPSLPLLLTLYPYHSLLVVSPFLLAVAAVFCHGSLRLKKINKSEAKTQSVS